MKEREYLAKIFELDIEHNRQINEAKNSLEQELKK